MSHGNDMTRLISISRLVDPSHRTNILDYANADLEKPAAPYPNEFFISLLRCFLPYKRFPSEHLDHAQAVHHCIMFNPGLRRFKSRTHSLSHSVREHLSEKTQVRDHQEHSVEVHLTAFIFSTSVFHKNVDTYLGRGKSEIIANKPAIEL